MIVLKSSRAFVARASWAPAVFGLVLPACGMDSKPKNQTGEPELYVESYRIEGQINKDAVENFKKYLADTSKSEIRIYVKSAGGDSRYALQLGDLIKSKNAEIIVEGYCISSCAQAILPSARSVKVADGAVVVFHWSAGDIILPSSASWKLKNELEIYKRQESEFYLKRSIDPQKMKLLRDQSWPVCTIDRMNQSNDSLNRYGTAYKYSGVTPSLNLLSSIGIKNISGYWPKDQIDLIKDIRNAGFNSNFSVKYIEKFEYNISNSKRDLCK